jgi:hypothetical protein
MHPVLVGIVCSVISVLLTYTLTTLVDRKVFKAMLDEHILNHEKEHHKKSIMDMIEKHENTCDARQDLASIKLGLAFLISKQPDGDPRKFGLVK